MSDISARPRRRYKLPDAEFQRPACGVCHAETRDEGDFICEECGLAFSPDTLQASFADEDAAVCGAACDNYWHGAHVIKQGQGYDCGTCLLPAGHLSRIHWTGCLCIDLVLANPETDA